MKKVIVMSLGGSIIIPDKIEIRFLENFKKTLQKNYKNYKFIIVCGGGSIARKYISALSKETKNEKLLSLAGIRATRMNALFLMQLFGKEANDSLPMNMKEVKDNLNKNHVVICGALRYSPKSTSDGTAAKLASFIKSDFINITNIKGLYSENPKENKNAKFIPYESWKDFEKRANKIKYHAGEHFVLDQEAAKIIKKHKIKTYIIGNDLSNLTKLLNQDKFIGTTIAE